MKMIPKELLPLKTKTIYPAPKPLDLFLLVAYWAPGERWKVIGDFPQLEIAEKRSESLPRGYGAKRIFRLIEAKK